MMIKFQSTHPLRGATPVAVNLSVARLISIHAPLAGCDASHRRDNARHGYFNPRTPCGVRRRSGGASARCARFQSTHPLRGATPPGRDDMVSGRHFNPRTPCGVRLYYIFRGQKRAIFQSTHPLRGATRQKQRAINANVISIHAPLAGCDAKSAATPSRRINFNPRTPCGVRHFRAWLRKPTQEISIHAPLAGCDLARALVDARNAEFQSTHPLRGATRR